MSNFSICCGVQSMGCTVFSHYVSSRAETHLLKWLIWAPLALHHQLLSGGPSRFWMGVGWHFLLSAGWNFFLRFPELSELTITTNFLWSLELALFPNTTSRWSNLLYLYSNSYKQVFDYSLSLFIYLFKLNCVFQNSSSHIWKQYITHNRFHFRRATFVCEGLNLDLHFYLF